MKPEVDYRSFRLHKLNTRQFRHLKLLLYWPVFGLLFGFLERFYQAPYYYVMHCKLDDLIPFQEVFVIPYLFWFIYLIGMLGYTLFFDVDTFRRMMKFVMITYSVTLVFYFIFPSCQYLRPAIFPRENALTQFMYYFYQFDTNTNVCPSLHVIGTMAALGAGWNAKRLQTPGWRVFLIIAAVLICLSTVFLKQHSVIDLIVALPICFVAHMICYYSKDHAPYSKQKPGLSANKKLIG